MQWGGGTGTQNDPYKSLSFALSTGLQPGDIVWVAGNGFAYPYEDDGNLDPKLTTRFPLTVPSGVKVQYWDVDLSLPGLIPLPAIFQPGVGSSATCFFMQAHHATIPVQLRGYLNANQQSIPDTNQGFEIRGFGLAIRVEFRTSLGGSSVYRFVIDGVRTLDCLQSSLISSQYYSFDGLVQRCYFRVSPQSGAHVPILPLVQIAAGDFVGTESRSGKVVLQSVDMRTKDAPLQSSMITSEVLYQSDDFFELELKNCVINGRTDLPTIPPTTPTPILGAGIEFMLRGQSRGRLELENTQVQDCEGDGVLAVAEGIASEGEFYSSYSTFADNGDGQPYPTTLSSGIEFGESGVHLAILEGGRWNKVDMDRSHHKTNHQHGLFLEGKGDEAHTSAFSSVDVRQSSFVENGLLLTGTDQGHGFHADVKATTVLAEIHQSAFVGNRTCGIKYLLRDTSSFYSHQLDVTNSVLSLQTGQGAGQDSERAPITVLSEKPVHRLEFHLSHVTAADNQTAYAVSLDQRGAMTPTEETWLWLPNNTVDNSILMLNGAGSKDQAYYPEPPPSLDPALEDLWIKLFFASHWSNLGSQGAANAINYSFSPNNCFDYEPQLVAYTHGSLYLGEVFPGLLHQPPTLYSMIDFGGGSIIFATEADDVRGPFHPREVNHPLINVYIGRDRGAFEAQPDEP